MIEISLRRPTTTEVDRCASLLAAAFMDEPLTSWIIDEKAVRKPFLKTMFNVTVRQYLAFGDVLVDDAVHGISLGFPPDSWPPPTAFDDEFTDLRLGLPTRARTRLDIVDEHLAPLHPHEDHYYFGYAAVAHGSSRGLGTALIAGLVEVADTVATISHAEAGNDGGRIILERSGFAIEHVVDLPDGPRVWVTGRHKPDV